MIAQFIHQSLGLEVVERPLDTPLPPYLLDERTYSILRIEGRDFLTVMYRRGTFSLPQFRKQRQRLAEYINMPILIVLESISDYQRKALIDEHVPFAVTGRQLYAPMLGILFEQRHCTDREVPRVLSPQAQLVLTAFALGAIPAPLSQKEIAQQLNLSPMAVSRSVRQLADLELVRVTKDGRKSMVIPLASGRSLYELALPYLQTPLWRRSLIRREELPADALSSGEDALSRATALAPPVQQEYAVMKGCLENVECLDQNWCSDQDDLVVVEEWRVDPALLARDGQVDPISLSLVLADTHDERVEYAIAELIEETPWPTD